MKLTQQTQKATEDFIADEMDTAHIALLRHLTVRLYGTVGTGQNAGGFTGSGVILRIDSRTTYVLTAKHNLHIAAKHAGIATSEYAAYFMQKIKVELTKPDGGTVDGRITGITFPDGSVNDYMYDAAVLEIAGTGGLPYATAASAITSPTLGLTWLFTSLGWQRGRTGGDPKPRLLDLLGNRDAQIVLANGLDYYQVNPELSGFVLLQIGHGLLTSGGQFGGRYGLARRVVKIASAGHPTYIDDTHEHYRDVFTFDADDNNTALEGDSGGPIFALDATTTRSWLIGLHLGANFYADRTDNGSGTVNNAFTVVSTDRIDGFI